jgi:hypothetical protein
MPILGGGEWGWVRLAPCANSNNWRRCEIEAPVLVFIVWVIRAITACAPISYDSSGQRAPRS